MPSLPRIKGTDNYSQQARKINDSFAFIELLSASTFTTIIPTAAQVMVIDDLSGSIVNKSIATHYSSATPFQITGEGVLTIPTDNKVVKGINVSNSGAGYSSAPTLTFSDPYTVSEWHVGNPYSINNIIFVIGGGDSKKRFYKATTTISSGGSAPTHTSGITSNWLMIGRTALATVTVSAGQIASPEITDNGFGYTAAPTITFTGGGFSTVAVATALMYSDIVFSLNINSILNKPEIVSLTDNTRATDFLLVYDSSSDLKKIKISTITPDVPTGSVLFGSPTDSYIWDSANFHWDDTNNRLGVGTNAPTNKFTVLDSGTLNNSGDTIDVGSTFVGPNYAFGISGNAANLNVHSNSTLGADVGATIGMGGRYTGTQFAQFAIIKGAKENATGGDYATYLAFGTRANGAAIAERMRITSAGNLGIGTTSPTVKLEVAGASSTAVIKINSTDTSPADLRFATTQGNAGIGMGIVSGTGFTNNLQFNAAGFHFMTGNVGIGTTSPGAQAEVYGAGQITATITDGGVTTATIKVNSSAGSSGQGGAILFGGEAASGRFSQVGMKGVCTSTTGNGTSDLAFYSRLTTAATALTEIVRFTSGGNVGIGTPSPASKLQVSTDSSTYGETSAPFTIRGVTDSNKILAFGFHTTDNVGWIQSTQFGTAVKPLALQPNGGNVGIGTTSPFTLLHAEAATNTSTTAYNNFGLAPAAVGQLHVKSSDAFTTQLGGRITLGGNTAASGSVANSIFGAIEGFKTNANTANAGGGLYLKTTVSATGALTTVLTVTGEGNVGIGTASPNARLSVLQSNDAVGGAFRIIKVGGEANGYWDQWFSGTNIYGFSWAGGSQLLSINSAGNVGIGTGATSPAYKLDVVGDLNLASTYVYRINAISVLSANTLGSGVLASSLTSVGTITSGTWNGVAITGQYGGTGVANSGKFITLGGNLTTINAFAISLTASGTTSVTLPTSGTLSTLANAETLTNKTIAAGSNTISGLVNANLSGTAGITNANLANSAVTIGSTSISLGASSTTLAGLTSVTSTTFTGALTGNATTATTATSLTTSRNFSLGGVGSDVTSPLVSFNGTGDIVLTATIISTSLPNLQYVKTITSSTASVIATSTLVSSATYSATGSSGASTIVVNTTSGIAVGQSVTGTNIGSGALVSSISGTTLTLSVANTGVVSGSVIIGTQASNVVISLDATIAGTGLTFASGIINVIGTTNRILVNADSIDIASTYVGQASITTLGTITSGVWNGSVIVGQYGGTGVDNSGKTITLGGNLTTINAFAISLTASATTSVTLPTSGTLVNTTGSGAAGTWGINITGSAAAATSSTNATNLTGGGTISATSASISNRLTVSPGSSTSASIANATAGLGAIEVSNGGSTNAAFISFNRTSLYSAYFGLDSDNVFKIGGGSFGSVSYVVLHSSNFNTYSPTLTGTGASGTWGINISGVAASVTNGVYTTGTQTIGGAKTFSNNAAFSGNVVIAGASHPGVLSILGGGTQVTTLATARSLAVTSIQTLNTSGWLLTTFMANDNPSMQVVDQSGTAAGNLNFMPFGGNVGIGATSVTTGAKLDVSGTITFRGAGTDPGLYTALFMNDAVVPYTGYLAGYTLGFNTGGNNARNTRIYIDNAGLVGIGTTSPVDVFHVRNPTLATATVNTLNTFRIDRLSTGGVKYANSMDIAIGSYGTSVNSQTRVDFKLGNGATNDVDMTVMSLLGNGNVGIGTTSPGAALHVFGNNGVFGTSAFFSTGSGVSGIAIGNNGTIGNIQGMTTATSAVSANIGMQLNGGGFVGIGAAPGVKLDVSGASSTAVIRINSTDTSPADLRFATTQGTASLGMGVYSGGGNTNNLQFNAAAFHFLTGNVGLGTTDPNYKLDVSGTLRVTGAATFSSTVSATLFSGSGASLISIPNSATTATNANTGSAIVARDGSGNFAAGTITASLSGNATNATTAASCSGNSATATTAAACSGNSVTATTAAACSGNSVTATNATTAASCSGNSATATNATTAASCSGNAASVTNGVYTIGDQTIGGTKTFSSTVSANITGTASINIPSSTMLPVTGSGSLSPGTVNFIDITAGSHTLTLPASPAAGSKISFYPVSSSIVNYTIARSGSTIMGLAENLTVDLKVPFDLIYSGFTWVLA